MKVVWMWGWGCKLIAPLAVPVRHRWDCVNSTSSVQNTISLWCVKHPFKCIRFLAFRCWNKACLSPDERKIERKNVCSAATDLVVDFRWAVGASGLHDLHFGPSFILFLGFAVAHVNHHAGSRLCTCVQFVLLTWWKTDTFFLKKQ